MSTPLQLQVIEAESDTSIPDSDQDQIALSACKPSNRGKFSPDRDTWDRIHQDRYMQWQLGESIDSIAAEQGVTYNAVKNSLRRCELRLRPAEVLAARSMRLRLRTISGLQDEYFAALKALLFDQSPFIRLKALEHIRRTAGMENSAVHVSQVNVQNNLGGAESYEERLVRIRAAQKARMEPAALSSQTGRVLAMLPSGIPESE
jgi:hypothetical protein